MGDVIERVFEHCYVYLNVASPRPKSTQTAPEELAFWLDGVTS